MERWLVVSKSFLLLLNFVFALAGLALLIHAGIIQSTLSYYSLFFIDDVSCIAVLFIVLGVLVFVSSGGACCIVIRETRLLLIIYGLLLLTLVALLVCGGVLLNYARWRTDVGESLRDSMRDVQVLYVSAEGEDWERARLIWDQMQDMFECCGVDSHMEWWHLGVPPPNSCLCKDVAECDRGAKFYKDGCHRKLVLVILTSEASMATIAFSLAGLQLPGAVLSFILARAAGLQNYPGAG